MFLSALFLVWVCAAGIQCNFKDLRDEVHNLKVDPGSVSTYETLLQELEQCDGIEKLNLRDHIYYRLGLIHLMQNQEWKSVKSLEKVREGQGSVSQSAAEHLHNLYVKFGFWDKLAKDDEAKIQYIEFNSSGVPAMDSIDKMLNIAPYDYHARSLMHTLLSKRLAEELDVSTGQEFVSNNEVILEKHATRLSLSQRLSLHYEAAVVQMYIINSRPTHLRKCLTIDMDYQPCKRLTLFSTRLDKVNPSRSQILDPEIYAFGDESIDWNKVVNFYFKDKKPCIKPHDSYNFVNNYELVEQVTFESLEKVIGNFQGNRPDFLKFIDSILCQAASQTSSNKKLTSSICKKLVTEVLTVDERNQIHKSATQGKELQGDLLDGLWGLSPNLAMYVIEGITSKAGKSSPALQDQIGNFFKNQKLSNSNNKYVKTLFNKINKLTLQRQNQNQQRQRQQQEWFFRQQRQQQQEQQQQQQQQPLHTDKDYYKILNVPQKASSKEIRKAYLDFAKMYHPDKQGQLSEEQQKKNDERMSEINEAYEMLSDEGKRREYDTARSTGFGGGGMARGGNGMFREHGSPFQFNRNFKFNFGF